MTLYSEKTLANEHVLITGATGGIGYETTLAAVKAGASVTITGRNEEKLQTIKTEMLNLKEGHEVCAIQADISTDEGRKQITSQAEKMIGPVTCLVNNAGILGGDKVETLIEDDLRHIMEVNFTSTVLLTQQIYQKMLSENIEGSIVNVSSLSGLRGTYGNSVYSASKFALNGFMQSLALEAIERGIRVNNVCPGYVNTEMGTKAIQRRAHLADVDFQEQWKKANEGLPSGRITEPGEVANTIIFLLSHAAKNIVGESVKISGGSVM
ncbi:SDR family NAD(P)-dependent oxidoreductase [Texcoconibacillus texcoconensis]|uniref:NAD(P)-dependent dehydrogenase (Short-subunit alcohol dehydrogenase family) n=1 Tax=Texcoconibacillus texcoconensis TaxID=1095777 RepID=A0A840QQL9_9BACI|nr:NAD(P)-dependent dehydrogenase (short-subunit alcohol dehydrogenase family) [Texcoconibacillus texcoconensis]